MKHPILRYAPIVLPLTGALALAARFWNMGIGDEQVAVEAPLEAMDDRSGLILVDVADHLTAAERREFLDSLPGEPVLNSSWSEQEGLYRLRVHPDAALPLLAQLQHDPAVEFAEPDMQVQLLDPAAWQQTFDSSVQDGGQPVRPDDPLYEFQWHMDQIHVEGAWAKTRGQGVVVAVIDTGVAYEQDVSRGLTAVRDLGQTRLVSGYDFVSDDDTPLDEHGHGTHVAGTIAQSTNNAYGVAGVAPQSSIMPIRVLDGSGRGNTADIAESIRWAADNGANIINMSLGGPLPSRIMNDAVQYAVARGVTVIAAAGNSSSRLPSYPAAYHGVVSVASTQFDRTTAFYSNYGNTIDIAAPGGNTRVDQNGDGRPDGVLQETLAHGDITRHDFSLYMGTSMASPHAAGVAALLYSRGVTRPDRIEAVLENSASREVPQFDRQRYGAGIIDAASALAQSTSSQTLPSALWGLVVAGVVATGARRRRELNHSAMWMAGAGITGGAFGLSWLATVPMGLSTCSISTAMAAWRPLFSFGIHHAMAMSALVPVGAWLLFGAARSPRSVAALLGVMGAWTAWLAAAATMPAANVIGVPGVGALDQCWLAANAALACTVTILAARER
jgi:serine protease